MNNIYNFLIRLKKVLICLEPHYNSNTQGRSYLLLKPFLATIKISFLACLIAFVGGLMCGIILYLCQIKQHKKTYFVINGLINMIITTPYLLLVLFIINNITGPFWHIWTGFSAGLICLSIILTAVFARNCEQIFLQINPEIYQTAYTLGANNRQFIRFFLVKESQSYLILKLNSLFVSALAYTSILAIVGVEGIGHIAYHYGYLGGGLFNYQQTGFYQSDLMLVCILILFLLAHIINLVSNQIAKKLDKNS